MWLPFELSEKLRVRDVNLGAQLGVNNVVLDEHQLEHNDLIVQVLGGLQDFHFIFRDLGSSATGAVGKLADLLIVLHCFDFASKLFANVFIVCHRFSRHEIKFEYRVIQNFTKSIFCFARICLASLRDIRLRVLVLKAMSLERV